MEKIKLLQDINLYSLCQQVLVLFEPGVPLILPCPRDFTYPYVKPSLDILSTPRNHCASVVPFERRIHIVAGLNIVCCSHNTSS